MKQVNDADKIRIKEGRIALLIICLVLISWLALPAIITGFLYSNLEDRGLFGDSYGVLNSLFSGLAFVGIIYTILLQKQELRDTREVLKSQKEEFEEQNETLRIQRFENSLFQMLSLQRKIVEDIFIKVNGPPRIGLEGLGYFNEEFSRAYRRLGKETPNIDKDSLGKEAYNHVYGQYNYAIAHYFRCLYRIFRFIDESPLVASKDKFFYSKIVRAQLSNQELALLFYNCFSSVEGTNFIQYLEKYELLDNLPKMYLLDETHPNSFGLKAFGNKLPS